MSLIVNGHNVLMMAAISFIVSLVLVPICKKVSSHIGAMDIPNERKVHKIPMPRLGGLAIYLSFLICYMLFGQMTVQMLSIIIASFVIILFGIVDDINPLRARYKLVGQVIAACIIVFYGNIILQDVYLFDYYINFGDFAPYLTILFIVSCINAINLIDGLDGLAGGISSIYFLTVAIIALITNRIGGLDIILSIIMFGSTFGFLVHNFPPAKIFMGDTGSQFLGFIISIISLLGFKNVTFNSLVIPIVILAIPIFDTLFAILRRIIKGESIGTPDKEHFHHQLLKMKFSPRITVLIIYVINMAFALVSILLTLGDTKIATCIQVCLILLLLFTVLKTDILFEHKIKIKPTYDLYKFFNRIYKNGSSSYFSKLETYLDNNEKKFILTANPEMLKIANENEIIENAILDTQNDIIPDGIAVVKTAKHYDIKIKDRITGCDTMLKLLELANKKKKKIYLFGAEEEVLQILVKKINTSYPNIKILGYKNGYTNNKDKVFKEIIKLNPDICFVALGIPKQEEIIYKHFQNVKKGIYIGVGGSFDCISGFKKRAPQIFIKLNLEWLYRIIKEPHRIKRFYNNNIKFITLVYKDKSHKKKN